jgi:hypothetical protein
MRDNYEITEQLINELENTAGAGHLPLEQRLIDTAIWFHRNRHRIADQDIPRRMDFQEKVLDIFMELFALTVQRMQQVEGRSKSERLWLPTGMNGGGRRFA